MAVLVTMMGLVLAVCSSCASVPDEFIPGRKPQNEDEQQQFERLVKEARELYEVQPHNEARMKKVADKYSAAMKLNSVDHDTLWQAARACGWLAGYAASKEDRITYAKMGVMYAQTVLKIKADSTEGLYYLAVLSGLLADNDHAYGLDAVKLIDENCRKIIESGRDIDHGGAHRVLGAVLSNPDLPGPPTSIGSLRNGKKQLDLAVEIAPDWPENHLHLAAAEFLWAIEREKPEVATQARERLNKYLLGTDAHAPKGYEQEFTDWQARAKKLLAEQP
jgi:hypothetical protein